MGKHSSDSQLPFVRSVVGWFLPWFMVAMVVAVGIWFAVDALGQDDLKTPKPAAAESSEPAEPTEAAETEPEASPEPTKTAKPEDEKDPKGKGDDKKPEAETTPDLITADVTVQVLNGTGFPAADDSMADQLASLGYEVLSVAGSSKAYSATTVFYSFPEAQEAAVRLAERYGWAVAAKPSNLSATVDLHVIVGDDYL